MRRIKFLFTCNFLWGFLCLASSANEKAIPPRENDFVEDSKDERPMDKKYTSGLWLLYDCIGHYYACVDGESFKACQISHKKNTAYLKNLRYPCAPFKKFESRVNCLKEQYRLIQRGGNLSLCNFNNR